MRPLYFLLAVSLGYSFRLFYRRQLQINNKHPRYGSTIYVCNHPNSFMDPLLIGHNNKPIVHFMARADVFKWWLKPIVWAAHMLPIYRQHDGEDTKAKNQGSFDEVNRSLAIGRNILIFGEGFTDDVAIRGLKPVKKGAARMGFSALEAINWSKNIYMCALGITYTDRNTMGSESLLVNGERICLNDYKDAYQANPSKTINEVTKLIERDMQECITYVADKNWYSFLENVMQLTRKGINHQNHDRNIPLKERWEYSRRLAKWMNAQKLDENEELVSLKKDMDAYFNLQKRMKMQDRFVLAKDHPELKNRTKELLIILFAWPLAILGMIHGFIPYIVVKKFTEKSFRRKVFWGSVKMMLGKLLGTIYNIPIICVVTHYFLPYWWLGIIYYFIVPMICWVAWRYVVAISEFRIKGAMDKIDVSKFADRRAELVKRVHELVPVA
ncbi:MAG TPA: 1-acyl-sn-glycerol-3-phosphate acyltransferase [Fluviicola sp.]|nr:1-acyl-sn-glycerol-3-phosphate acyltransferase [Fluviicola sp.]